MSTKLWGFEYKPDWPLLKWAQELREDVIFGREKVALLVYAKFAILLSYSHSVVMLHSKSTPLTLFFLYYTFHLKCKVVCSCVCVYVFFFGGWGPSFYTWIWMGVLPFLPFFFYFLDFTISPLTCPYDCGYSFSFWAITTMKGILVLTLNGIYVDFWISWTLSSCMQTNWKINDWDFFCLAWITR